MPFAGADKPRVEERVCAMVRARLRDASSERDVCIIDVSTRGLLATAANPPTRGEFVEITVGRHQMAGQVKWSGDHRFGIVLQQRVSVAAVVEGGKGDIALDRSPARAQRRFGMLASLRATPQMLGRMTQMGIFLVAAVGAALVIAEMAGFGLEPMQQAVMAMSDSRG